MIQAAPIYKEVWTIDRSERERWGEFLVENGLTVKGFEDVLAAHRAAKVQFGSVAQRELASYKEPAMAAPCLLWSNREVEVYMPSAPRVLHHLWVVLKRPAQGLCEVEESELIEMRKIVRKIQTVLREQFQTPTFIAQWNQTQKGQLPGRFTIEVIPARPESKQTFDLYDKMECNNYFLWRTQFPSSLPGPTAEEIAESSSFWKGALKGAIEPFSDHPFGEPIAPRSIVKTRRAEAVQVLRNSIFQILEKRFKIEREATAEAIQFEEELATEKPNCTFCNQAILDSEKIFETDLSYVLYNYKPATLGAHFLTFPKRHVRSSEDLREDELRDLYFLSKMLIQVLEEKTGRSDIELYTQDDPAVAQKIPHSHTHVILTPDLLKNLIFSMNYDKEPTLTREEMEKTLSDMKERLANRVQFKEKVQ